MSLRHNGCHNLLQCAFIILPCLAHLAEREGYLPDRNFGLEQESANRTCRDLNNTEAEELGKVLHVHARRAAELDISTCPPLRSSALDNAFTKLAITARHRINTQIHLENTHWNLVSILNSRIAAQSAELEIYISLVSQERAVHGFAGCNRLLGHYEAERHSIRFTGLPTTKKICAEGMGTERALLEALRMTAKWNIEDEYLELRNTDGELLAQFQRGAKMKLLYQ